MGEEIPQEPNKAAKAFIKIGAAKNSKPDNSGPWQLDCFACDEMHDYAVYGEQELADQVCDSIYIADEAIMKMMNS